MNTRSAVFALNALALATIAFASPLASQSPAAPLCDSVLAAPTSDTIRLRALLRVHAFDRSHDVPETYQQEFLEGMREVIRLPAPLAMDSYETDRETPARTAHLALRGTYRATLTRDGRLLDAKVTAGARNTLMDRAMIDAMRALDSTGLLKEFSPADLPDTETPIVVDLTTGDAAGASAAQQLGEIIVSVGFSDHRRSERARVRSDSGLVFPLFAFRSPIRRVSQPLTQIPGFGPLRYPDNLRRDGIGGQVDVAFVIGPDGIAEDGSLASLRADRLEFLQAILNTLPAFRFRPLVLEGCPVRAMVEQPFTFTTKE